MYINTYNCGFNSEINDYLVSSLVVYTYTLCLESAYLPPAKKLGQGNIFRSVCQEFCSQPGAVHAGRYVQQAGSTHPTGMHTCYRNVFTSMCHFFCPPGEGVCPRWGVCIQGVCLVGSTSRGVCLGGSASRGGLPRGCASRGCLHPGVPASRGCLHPGGLGRPPSNWILRDTVNGRAVRILLECILVL